MVGAVLIGPVFTEPARAIADHQIAVRHLARILGIMASRDSLEKSLAALNGTDIDTALLAGSDDQASIQLQQVVRQIAQRTGLGIGTLKTLGTADLDAGFGRVGLRFATTTEIVCIFRTGVPSSYVAGSLMPPVALVLAIC